MSKFNKCHQYLNTEGVMVFNATFNNIIKDMYKHTEASVKMGKDLSNFVNTERRVKQGYSLTPIYLKFI